MTWAAIGLKSGNGARPIMPDEVFRLLDAEEHPGVPWPCLASFLPRIWTNHRLTTIALAARGLTVMEALAIIEDRPMTIMDLQVATKRLDEWIAVWRAGRCRVAWGKYNGRFGTTMEEGRLGPIGQRPAPANRARSTRRNVGPRNRPSPSGW